MICQIVPTIRPGKTPVPAISHAWSCTLMLTSGNLKWNIKNDTTQVAKILRMNLQYFRGSASEGATLYHVTLHPKIRLMKIMTTIASAIVRNGFIAFPHYVLFDSRNQQDSYSQPNLEFHSHSFSNRILAALQRGSEIFYEFDAFSHIFDKLRRLMLILYSHHSAELLSV